GHEHRRNHLGAERNQARTAGQRRLLLENVLLHRVPPRAPEFHGPTHPAPAALVQGALPRQIVLAAQLVAVEHLVADVGMQLLAQEAAHLFPERLLFSGKFKAHGRRRGSWWDLVFCSTEFNSELVQNYAYA